jgi:hypothetical protein
MDVLAFLKDRTAFIRHFYSVASTPFAETKRKIESGEAPYEPNLTKYDNEPPFTTEWIEAERCLEVLGRVCVSMSSAALKLYFEWRDQLGIELRSADISLLKKHGVLKGYKWIFGERLSIEWIDCPADFTVLEQVFLTRNRDQHPGRISTQSVDYHQSDLERFEELFFMSDTDSKIFADPELVRNRFLSFRVCVTAEKLLASIKEVETVAEWLEPRLIERRWCRE